MLRQAFQAEDGNFSRIGQFFLPVPNQANLGKNNPNFRKLIERRWN
jgi:hypothetical protein